MFLLQKFPTEIIAQSFTEGSREKLLKTVAAVNKHLTNALDIAQWQHWASFVAPLDDNVQIYLATHPLHVPLREDLFNDTANADCRNHNPNKRQRTIVEDMPQQRTTGSVGWNQDRDPVAPRIGQQVFNINCS